jgi:AcrR family transcriptional regulator
MTDQSRRERKKDETRTRIVNVAMELFERQGFDGTTMEQIAEEADIAKGTLYNYFPVKEAIISAFMRLSAANAIPDVELLLQNAAGTRTRLTIMFTKIAEWQIPHRELVEHYLSYRFTNILKSFRNPEQRSGFDRNLAMIIEHGQKAGEVRCDLPLPLMIGYLQSGYLTVILRWLAHDDTDLAEGFLQMVDMFLSGVGTGENDGGQP